MLLPPIGSVVFTDGNRAVTVIGYELDENGEPTGGLYAGQFAGVETVEQGYYGSAPGPKGLKPSEAPVVSAQTTPSASSGLLAPVASVSDPAAAPAPGTVLETAEPVQPDAAARLTQLHAEGAIDDQTYAEAIAKLPAPTAS